MKKSCDNKYNSDNQIFQRAILHASRPRSRGDGGHDGKVGEGQFHDIRINKIKHPDPGIAYLRTNFTHNFLNVSIVMFLFRMTKKILGLASLQNIRR